ncbi:DNA/RNA helicase domain-containing protein [Actinophytocola sp.]|uniref:DNA/RNA helicase domain-containing protein n=1 Tax=Actinophytocola sp. TaxID=1872138 RepID=UPI002ED18B6B
MTRGRHLIVVRGGPGTGKSVIALRLLAAIPRYGVKARYVTPSGTLRRQLIRAVTEADAAGLFVYLKDHVARRPKFAQVSLVDEARRMKRSGNYVSQLMSISRVCVLFLDERQIVRPDEGLTLAECQAKADQLGAICHTVELTAQVRCGGSLDYLKWLENLLFAKGGTGSTLTYDIGLAQNPEDLGNWVEERNRTDTRQESPPASAGTGRRQAVFAHGTMTSPSRGRTSTVT